MKICLACSPLKTKRLVFFCCTFIFFTILIALSYIILLQFKPVFEQKAAHAAKMSAINIINEATNDVFWGISSSQLVNITTNETGQITGVCADTAQMNKLKTKLSLSLQKYTENSDNLKISIPLGSLTPYAVLQGVGYRIPVKIVIDGFSKLDFESEFIQAGINQVKHKIYLIASVNVSVISAAMTKSETVTTEIPVAETVIVGTVPNYYGDNLGVIGR